MNHEIIIRQAKYSELDKIVDYLHINWRANHIFFQSPDFFLWQHLDPDHLHLLTYVLAEKRTAKGNEIIGLLGYMPFRRFDTHLESSSISLAIWHVRKDTGTPGLGLQLLNWINKHIIPDFIAAIGLSEIVIPIYRTFGYTLGQLHQSAIFAPNSTLTEIASGLPDKCFHKIKDDSSIQLQELKRSDGEKSDLIHRINQLGNSVIPRKSWEYLIGRFFDHPIYTYNIYAAYESNQISAIFVLREIQITLLTGIHSIFRIVDMIGPSEMLAKAAPALQRLITEHRSEYLDIMQWGINPEILRNAGFIDTVCAPNLVIPNYFEPFEKKNINIKIAFKLNPKAQQLPVRLMRADSDQDRPNRIS